MDLHELQKLRRKAVKALGLDRPVTITRVVGARLELTINDGQHYTFEIETPADSDHTTDIVDLNKLTVAELREIAKKNEIAGYGRMRKAQLVSAIQEAHNA